MHFLFISHFEKYLFILIVFPTHYIHITLCTQCHLVCGFQQSKRLHLKPGLRLSKFSDTVTNDNPLTC